MIKPHTVITVIILLSTCLQASCKRRHSSWAGWHLSAIAHACKAGAMQTQPWEPQTCMAIIHSGLFAPKMPTRPLGCSPTRA